jgi:hypothetical protein
MSVDPGLAMLAIAFSTMLGRSCASNSEDEPRAAWGEPLTMMKVTIKDPEVDPNLHSDGTPESLVRFEISVPGSWEFEKQSSMARWRSPTSRYPSLLVSTSRVSREEVLQDARETNSEILRENVLPEGFLIAHEYRGTLRAVIVNRVRTFDSGTTLLCTGFEYADEVPREQAIDRLAALCDGLQLLD